MGHAFYGKGGKDHPHANVVWLALGVGADEPLRLVRSHDSARGKPVFRGMQGALLVAFPRDVSSTLAM